MGIQLKKNIYSFNHDVRKATNALQINETQNWTKLISDLKQNYLAYVMKYNVNQIEMWSFLCTLGFMCFGLNPVKMTETCM